jgi:NAD+ synthase/NAD+ synthase (glutamine-hydrolysing)
MLKFTLAQLNPTIGDIDGNVRLMRAAGEQALAAGSVMVVFPELSLTAYYPADLLDDEDFQARVAAGVQAMLAVSRELPELYWVFGAPTPNKGVGKRLHNSLLVIKAGRIVLEYHKQLLPTYNIFDEHRHFEPGPDVARVLRIGSTQIGFLICEDGWNDEGQDYDRNPFQRLADAAPDLVILINASPSNLGRREQRHVIFGKASMRHNLPLVYVNQIGGHDQLIYDGASFAVEPTRGVVFEAQRFASEVVTLSFDPTTQRFASAAGVEFAPVNSLVLPDSEFYQRQLVLGLYDYARRCSFQKMVVGSSGGIDSALTLALAAEALGANNVTAITMPSEYSSTGSVTDSEALCRNLGVRLLVHPIQEIVEAYKRQYRRTTGKELAGVPLQNLQARARGGVLMEYSNDYNALLLTTGNKSEISVGYCTLYGDTNGGLNVIGDVYKTEVFALSAHLNVAARREIIPPAIIDKPPSAELAPGQKDTDSLPPYEVLDPILKLLIEGRRLPAAEYAQVQATVAQLRSTPAGLATVERVKKMIARNEYKRRQAPPILRVRARAFGSGRQMPIAACY